MILKLSKLVPPRELTALSHIECIHEQSKGFLFYNIYTLCTSFQPIEMLYFKTFLKIWFLK